MYDKKERGYARDDPYISRESKEIKWKTHIFEVIRGETDLWEENIFIIRRVSPTSERKWKDGVEKCINWNNMDLWIRLNWSCRAIHSCASQWLLLVELWLRVKGMEGDIYGQGEGGNWAEWWEGQSHRRLKAHKEIHTRTHMKRLIWKDSYEDLSTSP